MKDPQLKRYDTTQIIYHWVTVISIAVLLISGLFIYFNYRGTAQYFTWHLWATWVFLLSTIIHIWHDTVTLKRFNNIWMSRQDWRDAIKRVQVLFGVSAGSAPKYRHYNPAQIAFHWIVTADLLGLVVTGFILWKPARLFVAPFWLPWGWDAVFVARVLHQLFTFGLLVLILGHVYFAVLVPKNWPLLKSIFVGRVRLASYAKEHEVPPLVASRAKPAEAPARDTSAPAPGTMGVPR